MLVPRHSRYVIDLNRPPENTPMYAGANNTELCPTRFFSGEPLYRAPLADEKAEIDRRRAAYWQPYHDALDAELARLRASTATRSCGTDTASSPSCPGCSRAGCPT
jgi:N-formylglutamate deformylase